VASNIDIKGEGGYVVLSPAEGRTWMNWTQKEGSADAPSAELLSWLVTSKGGAGVSGNKGGTGGGGGSSLHSRLVDGRVPAGERFGFLRDLVYKLRKQGVSREEAEEACMAWWEKFDQPPLAKSELPQRQVIYELDRAWARVEPEKFNLREKVWAQRLKGMGGGNV
jgi:hypothetical protein